MNRPATLTRVRDVTTEPGKLRIPVQGIGGEVQQP